MEHSESWEKIVKEKVLNTERRPVGFNRDRVWENVVAGQIRSPKRAMFYAAAAIVVALLCAIYIVGDVSVGDNVKRHVTQAVDVKTPSVQTPVPVNKSVISSVQHISRPASSERNSSVSHQKDETTADSVIEIQKALAEAPDVISEINTSNIAAMDSLQRPNNVALAHTVTSIVGTIPAPELTQFDLRKKRKPKQRFVIFHHENETIDNHEIKSFTARIN